MTGKNGKISQKFRLCFEAAAMLLQNAHFRGFFTGRLYTGAGKAFCVPGINCYSCPGAVGSCPLGALQNALGAYKFRFPYYVCGLLLFFGTLLGRAVCGFLCPFGFIEELIYRIPVKKHNRFRLDKPLRYLKYLILILLIVLPLFVRLVPFFCKYLCPSGTLAGVLTAAADSRILSMMGGRFFFKLAVLLILLILSAYIFRPFCRYLCPLGAFYGFFNHVSAVRLTRDVHVCTSCGTCDAVCPMNASPLEHLNSAECIRCGLCTEKCPADAISLKARFRTDCIK